jgi:DNA (cytosine-5)-methyltransferase 1
MKLTVGSLFAGIGGFDLGLERTGGFKTVWQVEIDPYARRVLEKQWPNVLRWDDVRTFPPKPIKQWKCDVICGGFPCQDISDAGKRQGIDGERSGLWSEFARVLRVLRPRYVIVENSAAIVGRGLGRVLGDLSEIGFDAEWSVVSACSMGALHRRERMLIVAHANVKQSRQCWGKRFAEICNKEWNLCKWPGESEPVRMVDGVPNRLDRNHCLGNAIIPQIVQMIGNGILAIENVK